MSFRIPVGYTPLGPTLSTARSAGLQRNVGLPQSASDSVRQAPFGSSIGPQRERFRSNGIKDVYTTFSLLVGNGRGFAQGILPLFILSASSLNKLSHFLHVLLGSSAVNDCRQRHRYYGAFTNSVGREDVIPTAVVCPKGSHMLAVHPFMTDFFTSSIILILQHPRSKIGAR